MITIGRHNTSRRSGKTNGCNCLSRFLVLVNSSVTGCLDSIKESSPLVTGPDGSEHEINRHTASICTPKRETIIQQRLIADGDEKHKCMHNWMVIYWLQYMHYMASYMQATAWLFITTRVWCDKDWQNTNDKEWQIFHSSADKAKTHKYISYHIRCIQLIPSGHYVHSK